MKISIGSGRVVLWGILGLMIYFTIFHKLGSVPVYEWDESLFANRAAYMSETSSYMSDFSLALGEEMHHRNTKMPLMTLVQAGMIKILGYDILALRLPGVILFLLLAIWMFFFTKKNFSEISLAVLWILVMISAEWWVRPHIIRTGDHDAPFAIFLMGALMVFFEFVTGDQKSSGKNLLMFSGFVIMAALTKNMLAFIPGLAFAFFLVYKNKFIPALKDVRIWLSVLVIFLAYSGVIVYFDSRYPGFWARMWNYELGGRLTNAIENTGPWWKYLVQMSIKHNMPFFLFACASIFFLFLGKIHGKLKDFVVLNLLFVVTYLLVISVSRTKCNWYDAPIIPPMGMLAAVGIFQIWNEVKQRTKSTYVRSMMFFLLCVCILVPYIQLAIKVTKAYPPTLDARSGPVLETMVENHPEIKKITLAVDKWNFAQGWYIHKLKKKGIEFRSTRKEEFSKGERVFLCSKKKYKKILGQYSTEEVYTLGSDCKLILILDKK